MEFTHFDKDGKAVIVDISKKEITYRQATAQGCIRMSRECLLLVMQGDQKKGDVLGVARIAGIMAAKRTSELIPLCHGIPITNILIDFEMNTDENEITVLCTASSEGKTGVEMEAMTGVSVALLTIYDMCKAVDKRMEIGALHLIKKSGGKSGEFIW